MNLAEFREMAKSACAWYRFGDDAARDVNMKSVDVFVDELMIARAEVLRLEAMVTELEENLGDERQAHELNIDAHVREIVSLKKLLTLKVADRALPEPLRAGDTLRLPDGRTYTARQDFDGEVFFRPDD